jgi:hypothetical protein
LEFISELRALPNPPLLGLLTGNIRLGAEIKLRRFGLWENFETGAFADDGEDRNHIAVAALERGRRVLGKDLQPREVVVISVRTIYRRKNAGRGHWGRKIAGIKNPHARLGRE